MALRRYNNVPLSQVPTAIRNGQTDTLLNAGFIDVTLPPYSCNNSGTVNCTTAFQNALNDSYLYNFVTYAPKGTYLLNKLDLYQIYNFGNFGASNSKHAMQLIGDTFGGNYPTLKVSGDLTGLTRTGVHTPEDVPAGVFLCLYFENTQSPFPDDPDYDRIYATVLRGFNIDMGNNPNGTGVFFSSAQNCSIEDVNIFGTAFACGINDLPGSGGSCTNIKITGGTRGIRQTSYRPCPSVHNVELINQSSEGILIEGPRGAVCIAGFRITGSGASYFAVRTSGATGTADGSKTFALVDGSIELSGGATTAISCTDNSMYMRNCYVKASTIVRQNSPGVTLAGSATAWRHVREWAYARNAAGLAAMVIDGVTATSTVHNLGTEDVPAPPAGLAAIHGWDATTFPCWHHSSPIDIRTHGAVQADTDDPGGLDNTTAIEAALTAGIAQSKAVFIPRGFFWVRNTVDIPAGTVLIGASHCHSVIHASRHWQPAALTDMIRTADAVGNLTIRDVCFGTHEGSATQGIESHKFITCFHGRTSNLLTTCMHLSRREWFDGGQSHFHAPFVKLSGNAGGRMYNCAWFLFHGSQASMHADHRTFLVSGTSHPLILYQPDAEGSGANPQAEILNSSDVTLLAFKHEPGVQLWDINGSDNICVIGGSGNYDVGTGAMLDVNTSTNVLVTLVSRKGATMAVPFLREDGVQRVDGGKKIVQLFKRGTPVPYGELVGAVGPAPQQQTLSTGTTSSVAAANLLIITVLGTRNATNSDVSAVSWTAPVGNTFAVNGGSDGRSAAIGFGQSSEAGVKSNTATWLKSNITIADPAIAGILVFDVGTEVPPPALPPPLPGPPVGGGTLFSDLTFFDDSTAFV